MSDPNTDLALAEIPSNAMSALNNAKYKIPGDVVNKATAELPDEQRSIVRQFHAHYMDNDVGLEETAKLIGMDGSTLSRVFRGKYEGSLPNVVREMRKFIELHEERGKITKLPFIKTKLGNSIFSVCHQARAFQRIAYVFGDTQIGKTVALEYYEMLNNHGSTIYVAVPTGGALVYFLAKLAKKLRISPQQRAPELRRRIIESFDARMLLIVDEAHRCVDEETCRMTMAQKQTIEFIREIFDESKCGVVICATNLFKRAMTDHSSPAFKLLQQTRRRRLCTLQLPDRPTREDLNTFAAAYGLPASAGEFRELEERMVGEEALGMWLTLLRMAAKIAREAKQPMGWKHVRAAVAGLKSLEGEKQS